MIVRRVKCDEIRPSCQRCLSTGRKCDGYVLAEPKPSSAFRWGSNTGVVQGAIDAGAMSFFVHNSIDQFSGNLNDEFWHRHVLQLAHEDAGTHHAVLALAHVHRAFLGSACANIPSALKHYNTAIRHHMQSLSATGKSRAQFTAPCAIIFICIELMQGRFASAIALSQRVASTMLHASEGTSSWTLIDRFQAQAWKLVNKNKSGRPPQHSRRPGMIPPVYSPSSAPSNGPPNYHDYCRQILANNVSESGITCLNDQAQQAASTLHTIMRAEIASLAPGDIAGATAMHLRRLLVTTKILAKDAKPTTEDDKAAISDALLPLYRNMVTSAEHSMRILDLDAVNNELLAPYFTLDMGFIGPLYEAASNCRDPTLRRDIVRLLRQRNRQEGLLNSRLCARAIEAIVAIEKHGLDEVQTAGDMPAWSRISDPSLYFNIDHSRFVLTFTLRSNDSDCLLQREVLI